VPQGHPPNQSGKVEVLLWVFFANLTALGGFGKKEVKRALVRYVGTDCRGYPATAVATVAPDSPGSGVEDSIHVHTDEKKEH
jgi:hypothetical protein